MSNTKGRKKEPTADQKKNQSSWCAVLMSKWKLYPWDDFLFLGLFPCCLFLELWHAVCFRCMWNITVLHSADCSGSLAFLVAQHDSHPTRLPVVSLTLFHGGERLVMESRGTCLSRAAWNTCWNAQSEKFTTKFFVELNQWYHWEKGAKATIFVYNIWIMCRMDEIWADHLMPVFYIWLDALRNRTLWNS